MKKYQSFLPENFQFLEVKFSIYLNRRVFVIFQITTRAPQSRAIYSRGVPLLGNKMIN